MQISEPDSDMAGMLTLSDREFKIFINMLRTPKSEVYNIEEQVAM